MVNVLVLILAGAIAVALISTIPRIGRFYDHVGAWLTGTAPLRRADIRLGTFLGVFIAAAVILT